MDKKKYKYSDLFDSLSSDIISQTYAFGEYLPTETELCERFGVSRITAQHALRLLEQRGYIRRSTKTGSRVIYISPQKRAEHDVVYYVADSSTGNRIFFAEGLSDELNKHGIRLIEKYFDNDEALLKHYVEECSSKAIGMILLPTTKFLQSDYLLQLKKQRFPFVVYDTYPLHPQFSTLAPDRFANVIEAFRYLVQTGHRNIGYFSLLSKYTGTMNDGRKGFLEATKKYDLPHCKSNIFEIHTDTARRFQSNTRMLLAKHVLSNLNGMTAIICGNDHLAHYLLAYARQLVIDVPKDLSVIGHDDYFQPDTPSYLPLTTIRHPFRKAGVYCAKILLSKLQGNSDIQINATIPGELIIRETTRKLTPAKVRLE